MPWHIRRELLTAAQRAELLALPTDRLEIHERYSLTPADFNLINRHRSEANRLGFAVQLCLLRLRCRYSRKTCAGQVGEGTLFSNWHWKT